MFQQDSKEQFRNVESAEVSLSSRGSVEDSKRRRGGRWSQGSVQSVWRLSGNMTAWASCGEGHDIRANGPKSRGGGRSGV